MSPADTIAILQSEIGKRLHDLVAEGRCDWLGLNGSVTIDGEAHPFVVMLVHKQHEEMVRRLAEAIGADFEIESSRKH